jgi:hypothetical protein
MEPLIYIKEAMITSPLVLTIRVVLEFGVTTSCSYPRGENSLPVLQEMKELKQIFVPAGNGNVTSLHLSVLFNTVLVG